jgi:hypothetical protein
MSSPDDLVAVYEGANVTEAHLVKDILLEEEIDATVTEENDPLSGLPITPPHVLVRRRDEPRARFLVEQYEEQAIERVESGEAIEDEDEEVSEEEAEQS